MFNEKNIYFNDNKYRLLLVDNSNLDGDDEKYHITNLKKNSMIIYEVNPINFREENLWYLLLNEGDILVLSVDNDVVLKRIKQIKKMEYGYWLVLDNDVDVLYDKKLFLNTNDTNMIIGKVKAEKRFIGLIISKLKRFDTTLIYYIFPLSLIIGFELIIYKKEKNEKE